MQTPTVNLLLAELATLLADTTTLGSASIGLIAAPFTPTPTLTLANITEANFSGYARKSKGSWSAAFVGADGFPYVESSLLQWIPSSTTTVNTIYGAFMTGSDSTKLIMSEAFSTPVSLPTTVSQLTLIERVGFDPNGNYGLSVVAP